MLPSQHPALSAFVSKQEAIINLMSESVPQTWSTKCLEKMFLRLNISPTILFTPANSEENQCHGYCCVLRSTKGDLRPDLVPRFQKCRSKWRSFCSFAEAQRTERGGERLAMVGLRSWVSVTPTSRQLPGKHQDCFFISVITHRSFFFLVHSPWLMSVEFPVQLTPLI